MLQRRHDDVNVEGNTQAQQQPRQRPDHPHHGALHHENSHDAARTRPQRAQNGNIGPLVSHRHHQGAHQIEGCHSHDERQDDEHHAFLDLHGGKPGAVLARPVADVQVTRQRTGQHIRHGPRLMQVAQLEPHARWAFEAENLGRIVYVHHG